MALQELTDEGYMTWTCHCGTPHTVHVSHDHIEVCHMEGSPLHHRAVALPACDCGARTYVKVDFTAEELAAPNMIDANGAPTESYAVAQRHMALVRHMEEAGKPILAPEISASPGREQGIVADLQAAGIAVRSLQELRGLLGKDTIGETGQQG